MAGTRPYRSVVRERAAALTRSAILEAAEKAFASRGFASASIVDIAERAEVAVGTVYAVFGGKAQLLAAILDVAVDGIDGPMTDGALTLQQQVERAASAPAVIKALADNMLENSQRWYEIFRHGGKYAETDPAIETGMKRLVTTLNNNFDAATDRIFELGAAKNDLTPADVHDMLWFTLGPPAWYTLGDLGWSRERAHAFLLDQALHSTLRRGRPANRASKA